jgi:hypothetical protein
MGNRRVGNDCWKIQDNLCALLESPVVHEKSNPGCRSCACWPWRKVRPPLQPLQSRTLAADFMGGAKPAYLGVLAKDDNSWYGSHPGHIN